MYRLKNAIGNDRILKDMGNCFNGSCYENLIRRYRNYIPENNHIFTEKI